MLCAVTLAHLRDTKLALAAEGLGRVGWGLCCGCPGPSPPHPAPRPRALPAQAPFVSPGSCRKPSAFRRGDGGGWRWNKGAKPPGAPEAPSPRERGQAGEGSS